MKPVVVILGSAFEKSIPQALNLERLEVRTKWGRQSIFQVRNFKKPAYFLFRHDLPHRLLPHQINYRAQAMALKKIDCGALMVTSSVGVLDISLPLFKPLLLTDLMMLDNRLPDGSTCTMFIEPDSNQGHLVVTAGLFSKKLNQQVRDLSGNLIHDAKKPVIFAYVAGPRTKTPAESELWRRLGARVNSMTLAPEVVLANELEIPCAGLVVGHKYSARGIANPDDSESMTSSLKSSREAMQTLVLKFLEEGSAVSFDNQIYRFGDA